MRADARFLKDPKTGATQVAARMYASGPMHDDEVIRMQGTMVLITPDGHVQPIGNDSWTFGDNLTKSINVSSAPKGSKVKVQGTVFVYRRREIKTEREMLKDGSIRLYMNTGTVTFRKMPNSHPPQLEVECLELGSVHNHGMELMSLDKKTVANRMMLTAGKQTIKRENLPFVGRQLGMEPYMIRQLIPKREEPVTLVIPVTDL